VAVTPERQRRGLAVRDELLKVAGDLFYSGGIQAIGVDTIVAESGIAKSTLYRWFPTKDDLVIAFLEDRDTRFWAIWDADAVAHPGDPVGELEAHLQWIDAYIKGPSYRGCPFLNTPAELADPDSPAFQLCRRNKLELRRRLRDLSSQIVEYGADELADQLVLVINGAFAMGLVFSSPGPHDALVSTARQLIETAATRHARPGPPGVPR
jgi:AcrR family transcriptional regulator